MVTYANRLREGLLARDAIIQTSDDVLKRHGVDTAVLADAALATTNARDLLGLEVEHEHLAHAVLRGILLELVELGILLQDVGFDLVGVSLRPLELMHNRLQVGANGHQLLDLGRQLRDDMVIIWLLLEMEGEYLLEHFSQGTWDEFEDLFCVLEVETLPQKVLKLIVGGLEFFVEISPGQEALVQQIDHYVHDRLDVIPSALVVAPARVEGCEQEVPGEFLCVNFLHVRAVIVKVSASEPKIN